MNKNLSRYRRNVASILEEIDERCPDNKLLEYTLLTAHQNRKSYERFEQHFLVCEACQRRIRLIQLFYSILDQEIRQAVYPATVEMAQKLTEIQRA